MTREYTKKLLEMIEDEIVSKDYIIMACVNYMSEDEVKDMMIANEIYTTEDEEDEEV